MHVSALCIVNAFAHIVLTLNLTPSPANLPIVLLTLRSKAIIACDHVMYPCSTY